MAEPVGYGGYSWGTKTEAVTGLELAEKPEGVTISLGTRPADGKTFIIGEYSFTANKEAVWMFLDNKFGFVCTCFTIENFQPVHDAISKTFGQPDIAKRDNMFNYFYWRGAVGRVMVAIPNNGGKEIVVSYASYAFMLNDKRSPIAP